MALSIFGDQFGKVHGPKLAMSRYRWGGGGPLNDKTAAIAQVTDAVQLFVDTMVDQRTGGRFVVGWSGGGVGAATNLEARKIVMPGSILLDTTRLLEDIANILTGLAAHEVGHTIYSRDSQKVIDALIAKEGGITPKVKLVKKLFNILDDVTLERAMKGDYPGIATTFPAFAEWIADQEGYENLPPRVWEPERMRSGDRTNFVLSATRFARFLPWAEDEATLAKRKAWQRWAARYAKPDIRVRVAGVKVALAEIMRDMPVVVPQPDGDEPEPITDGRPTRKPLGEHEQGTAEPQPQPKPQDDPADADDGLDYDEPGEGKPAPKPEPKPEPEPEPEPKPEPSGSDDYEDGDLGDGEAQDMADALDEAVPDIAEDDMTDVMRDTDDVIEHEKDRRYDGAALDQLVDRERKSEKVARSEFGQMRIEIR